MTWTATNIIEPANRVIVSAMRFWTFCARSSACWTRAGWLGAVRLRMLTPPPSRFPARGRRAEGPAYGPGAAVRPSWSCHGQRGALADLLGPMVQHHAYLARQALSCSAVKWHRFGSRLRRSARSRDPEPLVRGCSHLLSGSLVGRDSRLRRNYDVDRRDFGVRWSAGRAGGRDRAHPCAWCPAGGHRADRRRVL